MKTVVLLALSFIVIALLILPAGNVAAGETGGKPTPFLDCPPPPRDDMDAIPCGEVDPHFSYRVFVPVILR